MGKLKTTNIKLKMEPENNTTHNICENWNELNLPPVFIRNDKECYLDSIRKKLIYITPEETVRQKVISFLIDVLKVPEKAIDVECHLSHYGILNSKKRADIVIKGFCDAEAQSSEVIAVIECKAESVNLDDDALNQVLDYSDDLLASYAMVTNGINEKCYFYDQEHEKYILIGSLPEYEEMIAGKYEKLEIGELPQRIPFNEIEKYLIEYFDYYEYDYEISRQTPMKLSVPIFNFSECLLDTRVKMPAGDYGVFKLIEDYGVRMSTYGNSSGGKFSGPYRSFLVEVNGNTEFYSMNVSVYSRYSNLDKEYTCINVAHDDEKESHHSLQLVVEDNLIACDNRIDFYHHGKIAIGRIGSGKIDELREFVRRRRPDLIKDKRFYFGSLVNDRLWRLDDPKVINLIVNLITYSMIRDEYREYVKEKNK